VDLKLRDWAIDDKLAIDFDSFGNFEANFIEEGALQLRLFGLH